MGIPMGLQYSVTAIGSVILQKSVNRLGSVIVAAIVSGGKLNMFIACPFEAMGSTMATYAGQNLGAKKLKRVDQGVFPCCRLALVNIMRFTIQGLGFGKLAILAGVCEMTIRSAAGFYFVPRIGFTAAWIASPMAWIFADIFLVPTYFLVMHFLKGSFGNDNPKKEDGFILSFHKL